MPYFNVGFIFVAIVKLQGEMFAGVASSLESSHVKSVLGPSHKETSVTHTVGFASMTPLMPQPPFVHPPTDLRLPAPCPPAHSQPMLDKAEPSHSASN